MAKVLINSDFIIENATPLKTTSTNTYSQAGYSDFYDGNTSGNIRVGTNAVENPVYGTYKSVSFDKKANILQAPIDTNPNLKAYYPSTTYNGKSATYDYSKFREFDYVLNVNSEPIIERESENGFYKILKPFGAKVLGLDESVEYFIKLKETVQGTYQPLTFRVDKSENSYTRTMGYEIDLDRYEAHQYKDGTSVECFGETIYINTKNYDNTGEVKNIRDFRAYLTEKYKEKIATNTNPVVTYTNGWNLFHLKTIISQNINFTNAEALLKHPERFKNFIFNGTNTSENSNIQKLDQTRDEAEYFDTQELFFDFLKTLGFDKFGSIKGGENAKSNRIRVGDYGFLVNETPRIADTAVIYDDPYYYRTISYNGEIIYQTGKDITYFIDKTTEKLTLKDRLCIFVYTYLADSYNDNATKLRKNIIDRITNAKIIYKSGRDSAENPPIVDFDDNTPPNIDDSVFTPSVIPTDIEAVDNKSKGYKNLLLSDEYVKYIVLTPPIEEVLTRPEFHDNTSGIHYDEYEYLKLIYKTARRLTAKGELLGEVEKAYIGELWEFDDESHWIIKYWYPPTEEYVKDGLRRVRGVYTNKGAEVDSITQNTQAPFESQNNITNTIDSLNLGNQSVNEYSTEYLLELTITTTKDGDLLKSVVEINKKPISINGIIDFSKIDNRVLNDNIIISDNGQKISVFYGNTININGESVLLPTKVGIKQLTIAYKKDYTPQFPSNGISQIVSSRKAIKDGIEFSFNPENPIKMFVNWLKITNFSYPKYQGDKIEW